MKTTPATCGHCIKLTFDLFWNHTAFDNDVNFDQDGYERWAKNRDFYSIPQRFTSDLTITPTPPPALVKHVREMSRAAFRLTSSCSCACHADRTSSFPFGLGADAGLSLDDEEIHWEQSGVHYPLSLWLRRVWCDLVSRGYSLVGVVKVASSEWDSPTQVIEFEQEGFSERFEDSPGSIALEEHLKSTA